MRMTFQIGALSAGRVQGVSQLDYGTIAPEAWWAEVGIR